MCRILASDELARIDSGQSWEPVEIRVGAQNLADAGHEGCCGMDGITAADPMATNQRKRFREHRLVEGMQSAR